ncbi:NAAT family transporter [bacterium]|nr:MAG: NAAT family transporter [bacterium]
MTPAELVTAFVALFTLLNPVGGIPVFLTLTEAETREGRNGVALVASVAVAAILLVAMFLGSAILAVMHIELDAFRLAGMIVIIGMALSMLNASPSGVKQAPGEHQEAADRSSVAVVPLALPVLAGPGSISAVIIVATRTSGWEEWLFEIVIILLNAAATYGILRIAPRLGRMLGTTGMNVLTRLFGLLLLAIGLGGAAEALKALFPGLG